MRSIGISRIMGLAVAFGLVTAPALAAPVEYIENGGFETGDFTGWTITDLNSGQWVINDGTFDPIGPGEPLPPISGMYDLLSEQPGPGTHIAAQIDIVPSNISSAVLSWKQRVRNQGASYSDPNQEWRILIKDVDGNLIQEVFSTNPGDPHQQIGPDTLSFDVTSLLQFLEGQPIVISFEEEDNLWYFNVNLDDVSLLIDTVTDTDEDGIPDDEDNCVFVPNPLQENSDGDSYGDACDNCPMVDNEDQANADGDMYGDACDICPYDPDNDADGDGVCGDVDLCPGTILPEPNVPTVRHLVNHWIAGEDGVFFRIDPNGKGPDKSFTIAETGGCNCEQIIELLGLGYGHMKHGCSNSAMEEAVALASGDAGMMGISSDEQATEMGGCSVGSRGSSAGAGLALLFLLGFALRLRRR